MLHCNIVIAFYEKCGNYRRAKKMYVDESLTEIYRSGGCIPRIGEHLPNGELVIDKKSDNTSILLFINPKKRKKHGI